MKALILGLATLTLMSSANADTSGRLILRGIVPQMLSIEVSPEPMAQTLNLSQSVSGLKVASVKELSNSNSGYKVTVESMNKGHFVRFQGLESIPYTMTYGGQTVNLTQPTVFTNAVKTVSTQSKEVKISYIGVENSQLVAGEYSDTVTFTISAN